jgi:hypothetical protein
MLGLDQNAGFLIAALAATVVVFGGYLLYLRSRLDALRRRTAHSERNVSAAPPRPATAHATSSANGPSAP